MAPNQTTNSRESGVPITDQQGQMEAAHPPSASDQQSGQHGSAQSQMGGGAGGRSTSTQSSQDAGPQAGQYGQFQSERRAPELQSGQVDRMAEQRAGKTQSSDRGLSRAYARDPLTMLHQMSEEMDNLFSSFFNVPYWNRARNALRAGRSELQQLWSPDIEMSEQDHRLRVCVDLPGIARENVNVGIKDGILTVQGERREERTEGDEKSGFRRSERRYGSFYRAVALPEGVDAEAAEASMKDGVLEVTFPIAEEKQAKRLQIR